MKKANKNLQRFIATRLRRPLDKVKTMTPETILDAVRHEKLFGCIECDIHVPEHFSCKGVNKKNNVINKDKYLDVILSKRSGSGVNRGFRVLDNRMCTYVQGKNAFSYFYPKRKVLEDGVSTTPLDISSVNSYFANIYLLTFNTCVFYFRLCPRWDMCLFCCNGTRGTQFVPQRDFVSLHGLLQKLN